MVKYIAEKRTGGSTNRETKRNIDFALPSNLGFSLPMDLMELALLLELNLSRCSLSGSLFLSFCRIIALLVEITLSIFIRH